MRRRIEDQGGGRDSMKPKATGQERKPYRPPHLMVYGDLHRLTMAKGGTKGDGAGVAKSKSGTG